MSCFIFLADRFRSGRLYDQILYLPVGSRKGFLYVPLGVIIFQALFWTASPLIKLIVAVVVLIIIGRAVRMLLNRYVSIFSTIVSCHVFFP